MKKILAALLLAVALPAAAQNVQQSGSVTAGHVTKWITNGVIGDAGTASNPGVTSFGTYGSGPTNCAQSAATSTGNYNRVCLNATSTALGLTVDNIGSATGDFSLKVNGTAQSLVTVALPTTADQLVCFSNTTGGLKACTSGATITIGTTAISGGTDTKVLYDNNGVVGEYTISGTGDVAMTNTPSFTTPALGAATGASISLTGAATIFNATSIPAGGSAGDGYKLSSTSNFGVFFGSGAPTLAAAQGSLYLRSDGVPYYNTDGSTSWTSLASGSGTVTEVIVGAGTGIGVSGTCDITTTGTCTVAIDKASNSNAWSATSNKVLTTDILNSAGEPVALTDGSSITFDEALGVNFSLLFTTHGGTRTLSNATHGVAGRTGCITVTQDGTGGEGLTLDTNWYTAAGAGLTLSTGANAADLVCYSMISSTVGFITVTALNVKH